jgi:hypothetical protein
LKEVSLNNIELAVAKSAAKACARR